jgi:PKD repeat protein
VSYDWDWGDGSTGTGRVASHTYPAVGTSTIQLTVTNNQGLKSSARVDISAVPVGKLIPSAHIQGAVPGTGHAPLLVTFLGHGHDDTEPLSHLWDFGDGSPPVTMTDVSNHKNTSPSHVYELPGTYTCTLRVQDSMNLSGSTSMSVTVEPTGSDKLGGHCGGTGLEALVLVLLLRIRRRRR